MCDYAHYKAAMHRYNDKPQFKWFSPTIAVDSNKHTQTQRKCKYSIFREEQGVLLFRIQAPTHASHNAALAASFSQDWAM